MMNTTVDESTGVRDARFTEHTRRSAFLAAVHQAIEIDGLPAPMSVNFGSGGKTVTLRMDDSTITDVDDWAANFNAPASYDFDGRILTGDHPPFRSYKVKFDLGSYRVEVWTSEYLPAEAGR